ncbi:MAG: hypothetical protein ABI467_22980 [Kofleriaceae bacterium]
MKFSTLLLFCTGLIASCGKHSTPAQGGEPAKQGEPAEAVKPGASPSAEPSPEPLDTTIQSKVNNVAFTVTIPKGWKFAGMGSETQDDPAVIVKKWKPDLGAQLGGPSVMISYLTKPPTDLASYLQHTTFDADTYVTTKQETLADGFIVAFRKHDNGILVVELMRTKGEAHMMCRASQSHTGGIPDPDARLGWLEKMCESLTLP